MFRISWNNFIKRKFHSLIIVINVAVATSTLVLYLTLEKGILNGLDSSLSRMGADIIVTPSNHILSEQPIEQILFTSHPANIYMDKGIVEKIKAIEGVSQVTAQFFTQTLNESCCSIGGINRIVGFDQETDFVLKPWMQSRHNDNNDSRLKEGQIIAGGFAPIPLGKRVIMLGEVFTIMDRLEPVGGSIDTTLFVPIDTARKLAYESPLLKTYWRDGNTPNQLVSSVLVQTSEPNKIREIASHIESNIYGVKATVASEVLRSLKQQIQFMQSVVLTFSFLLWVVVILGLGSHYASLTMEKKKQVGLLRALGATRSGVFKLVVLESLISTSVGGMLGLLSGNYLLYIGIRFINSHTTYPFLLPSWEWLAFSVIISMSCSLLMGLLASLYPAYCYAKLDPVIAITQGELE